MRPLQKFPKRAMRIIEKPWGHEEVWAETDKYLGKILVILPGQKLSRQYHVLKEETFRVLEGNMNLEIGGMNPEDTIQVLQMKPGDTYHCPPGLVHRMCASTEGCSVLEVSTAHIDDVVRLVDDYSRRS